MLEISNANVIYGSGRVPVSVPHKCMNNSVPANIQSPVPLASYEIKYLCHLCDIQGCLGCFGFFSTDLFEILLNGNEQMNNCNNFLITFLHCKELWEDSKACVVDSHL